MFLGFAEEARGSSPLYETLSLAIAEDEPTATILASAQESQRRPNLLFAAVHDLLLSGVEHRLADYYASVGGALPADEDTFTAFRSFLDTYRGPIDERLRTRATQTNEPGRCSPLFPALASLRKHNRDIALVEVGASAGLLLHLDRYRYRYEEVEAGDPTSSVVLCPELRGTPPRHLTLPTIGARVGIDLAPLDPSNAADASWLKACVWPENVGRLQTLEAALTIASENADVRFVSGDFVELLEPTVREVEKDLLVCVLHSAAFAYLDVAQFKEAEETLERLGAERDLVRLSFEGPFIQPFVSLAGPEATRESAELAFLVGMTTWFKGKRNDRLLARAHGHGAWLEWLEKDEKRRA